MLSVYFDLVVVVNLYVNMCMGHHMSVQYVLAVTPCPGWISSEFSEDYGVRIMCT